MKIAVISDIHSNPRALEKALADAKEQGCKRTICLGDIVGYGYDPVACIDICREHNISCCLGNHDAGLIGRLRLDWFSQIAKDGIIRQRKEVDEEHRKFLEGLPFTIKEEIGGRKICFSHGSFSDPSQFNYIQGCLDAAREIWLNSVQFDCLFVGHTHEALAFVTDEIHKDMPKELSITNAPDLTVKLSNWIHVIVNAGSVGYPRVQKYSVYVIYDTEQQTVSYRSLPFDFNDYVAEMEKRDIPLPLWLKMYMSPDVYLSPSKAF